ncbi:hypothetical protein BHE74_00010442 [Ensete ventricosum]|nr:hypothetical protein BHE74_00010442 [Ensete ventricosum]
MIKYFKISQVPHIENLKADALVKSASANIPIGDPPMIATIEEVTPTMHSDWREKILCYKKDTTFPTDKEVRPRPIGMGDLVLRKAKVSDLGHSHGTPRWEGLYRIVRVIRDGTYTLATMEGKILPRT